MFPYQVMLVMFFWFLKVTKTLAISWFLVWSPIWLPAVFLMGFYTIVGWAHINNRIREIKNARDK